MKEAESRGQAPTPPGVDWEMTGFLGVIFSIIGVVVGVIMILYIFYIAHINPIPLYIALTIGFAIGSAWLNNMMKYNKPLGSPSGAESLDKNKKEE